MQTFIVYEFMWCVYTELKHAMAIYGWQTHFWETEKDREKERETPHTRNAVLVRQSVLMNMLCGDMIEIVVFCYFFVVDQIIIN